MKTIKISAAEAKKSGLKSNFISTDEVIKKTFGICLKGSWPYEKKETTKKEKKTNIHR